MTQSCPRRREPTRADSSHFRRSASVAPASSTPRQALFALAPTRDRSRWQRQSVSSSWRGCDRRRSFAFCASSNGDENERARRRQQPSQPSQPSKQQNSVLLDVFLLLFRFFAQFAVFSSNGGHWPIGDHCFGRNVACQRELKLSACIFLRFVSNLGPRISRRPFERRLCAAFPLASPV